MTDDRPKGTLMNINEWWQYVTNDYTLVLCYWCRPKTNTCTTHMPTQSPTIVVK